MLQKSFSNQASIYSYLGLRVEGSGKLALYGGSIVVHTLQHWRASIYDLGGKTERLFGPKKRGRNILRSGLMRLTLTQEV